MYFQLSVNGMSGKQSIVIAGSEKAHGQSVLKASQEELYPQTELDVGTRSIPQNFGF